MKKYQQRPGAFSSIKMLDAAGRNCSHTALRQQLVGQQITKIEAAPYNAMRVIFDSGQTLFLISSRIDCTGDARQVELHPRIGTTVEDLPLAVALFFSPDAVGCSPPEKMAGIYQTEDGCGVFEIVLDGRVYRDVESGSTHLEADELLPWAVAQGAW
jgi:hypothetical protein